MVTIRTRKMSTGPLAVGYTRNTVGTVVQRISAPIIDKTTTDVNDNYGRENPFESTSIRLLSAGILNGGNGTTQTKAVNCPVSSSRVASIAHIAPIPEAVHSHEKVLAEMAPSEPQVSVPLLIYELPELPRIWKAFLLSGKRFDNLPQTPGSDAWLAYNFGLAPLVSDLFGFLKVTEWVNSRQRMLLKAQQSDGYVRRQRGVYDVTLHKSNSNAVFDSTIVSLFGVETISTTRTQWVSGRWRTTGYTSRGPLTDSDNIRLYAAALGIDLSFRTLFDMIPWSWLLDWCSTLPAIISLNSNRAGFSFAGGSLMTNTLTQKEVRCKTKSAIYTVDGVTLLERETKHRTSANPSILDTGLNLIGAKQATSLAAIVHSGKNRSLSKYL